MNLNFQVILLVFILSVACNAKEMQKMMPEWFTLSDMMDYVTDTTQEQQNDMSVSEKLGLEESYKIKRDNLIKKDKQSYFTVDVHELNQKEKQVEEHLFKLRDKVVQGDHSPLKLDFYEGKHIVETSEIFNAMKKVPKGAHLHLHTSASIPLDVVMSFTKEDIVYYSFDENKLIAAPKGMDDPSYQK